MSSPHEVKAKIISLIGCDPVLVTLHTEKIRMCRGYATFSPSLGCDCDVCVLRSNIYEEAWGEVVRWYVSKQRLNGEVE